ncbi:ATP-binding protein [Isoptericola sp. NPDC019693]|uniref:ATP-binding protein n=1 Tax=Isoptericola sp. NPDC019693 TaxID=3364009 RepID=UPI003794CCF4
MTPVEAAPVGRLDVVGTWAVRTVDDLADVRAELEACLPCDCSAARVGPARDVGGLSGRQRMVLVASELVANALEHARPPVVARLLCDGHVAVVDVVDRSPEAPPVVPHDREPGEGGHGLRLAETIADRVGWYRTDRGEKHVWARFTGADHARAAAPQVPARQRLATHGAAVGASTGEVYRGA